MAANIAGYEYDGPYGEQSYMKLPSGDKVVIKLGDDGIPILPHESPAYAMNVQGTSGYEDRSKPQVAHVKPVVTKEEDGRIRPEKEEAKPIMAQVRVKSRVVKQVKE